MDQANGEQSTPHARHGSVDYTDLTLPKKLIVCCDGTWMDADNGWVSGGWFSRGHLQTPSNVSRIARAVNAEDDGHHPQIVYYQAGIGTGIGLFNHLVGGGTGLGLSENIREAYAFLASNYREEDPDKLIAADSIFLLGFSRGAFTARSLGGLIGAVGVLKKRAMSHFYEIFSDWENAGNPKYQPLFFDSYFRHATDVKKVKPSDTLARDRSKIAEYVQEYREALLALGLTQEARVKCIGVWDTVGSLGIPVNPLLRRIFPFLPCYIRDYSWFDTSLDNHVSYAFQALALDEHRFPFSPTVWEKPPGCTTHLKQVWFPGAHSNVGGSYADTGMADITLAWMMDQLAGNTREDGSEFQHHDWIKFDDDHIQHWIDSEQAWYEENKQEAYKGWAMGRVCDSNTFPQSLAGTRVRSPGLYHRIHYETGNTDHRHLLQNTHELVHASVRARTDMGGRPVEPEPQSSIPLPIDLGRWIRSAWHLITFTGTPTYTPQRRRGPLHGWKLEDGHASHRAANWNIDMTPTAERAIVWRYEGASPCALPENEMREDRLGPYEQRLLRKDRRPLVDKIVFTNNSWEPPAKPQPRSRHHGRTFPLASAGAES